MKIEGELENFVGVLKQIDESLGLTKELNLFDASLIRSLHFATNGIMDYMVKVMIGAYRVAIEKGLSGIDRTCLERSFTEYVWVGGIGKANPFNKKFHGKRLDKAGEPFYDSSVSAARDSERIAL